MSQRLASRGLNPSQLAFQLPQCTGHKGTAGQGPSTDSYSNGSGLCFYKPHVQGTCCCVSASQGGFAPASATGENNEDGDVCQHAAHRLLQWEGAALWLTHGRGVLFHYATSLVPKGQCFLSKSKPDIQKAPCLLHSQLTTKKKIKRGDSKLMLSC